MTATVRPNSSEWQYMWSALAAEFGATSQPCPLGTENWQYMGSNNHSGRWEHEFRHRNHPKHGRIVWSCRASSAFHIPTVSDFLA